MRTTILPILLLAACGDGDPGLGDGHDAAIQVDGDPEAVDLGTIRVTEQRGVFDDGSGVPQPYRSSSTTASFHVGGPPVFHREAMVDGPCVLATYQPMSCTPACVDGLCVGVDECEPFGTLASAGRLTIAGTTVGVTVDPQAGYYYNDTVLPEDLFADDATITATLAGDEIGGATLTAEAVPPIVTDFEDGVLEIPNPAGADFPVRWTPAGGAGARVRVTINANNQGHGMPYLAILTCDVPDSAGEVMLPEAMLDAFPETDAWQICAGTDCPRSTIVRYRRDTASAGDAGDVELVVGNGFDFGVVHPGS